MKKIFAMIIAVAMIASLAIVASAAAFTKGATLDVKKGTIVLDGRDTDGEYGDYLAYFTGAEVLAAQAKITAETYDWANGYMAYGTGAWKSLPELAQTNEWISEVGFGLKAKYDDEALYVLVVTVYPKSIKFYFNPEAEWSGNCMQFIFAAADNYTGMCYSDTYKDGTDFDMMLAPASASSVVFNNYNGDPIYTEDYAKSVFKSFYDGVNTFSYELKFEFEPLKITVNPGTVEFYFGAGMTVTTREDADTNYCALFNLGSVVFGAWDTAAGGHRVDIKDYGYGFKLLAGEDEPKEDEPKEDEPKEDEPKEDEPAKEDDKKEDNPGTADVSAVMYVLATLSTIGGAIVLKRK